MNKKLVLSTLAGLCVATIGGLSQPASADTIIRTVTTGTTIMEPSMTIIERPAVIERVVERPVVTERIVERPVVTERIVERPVFTERIVERPVYTERVIESPVVIERAVQAPIVIENTMVREPLVKLGLLRLLHLDLF